MKPKHRDQATITAGRYGVESLNSLTDVNEALLIVQDLLDDECGDGLWQLLAFLHDSEAEWNDLSLEQEVNDILIVPLDERTDNAKTWHSQILKWFLFALSI